MGRSKGMDGASVLVLVNLGDDVNPNWVAVAEQTSLSTETSRNLIEATSKDSDHTKWIYGKQDDTVSLESLYVPDDTAFKAIEDALKNKETIILRRSENGEDVEEATAFVSQISKEWPDNDTSTCSVDFQLDEPWTLVTP
jgi:TP901-1 family phage major tail protein